MPAIEQCRKSLSHRTLQSVSLVILLVRSSIWKFHFFFFSSLICACLQHYLMCSHGILTFFWYIHTHIPYIFYYCYWSHFIYFWNEWIFAHCFFLREKLCQTTHKTKLRTSKSNALVDSTLFWFDSTFIVCSAQQTRSPTIPNVGYAGQISIVVNLWSRC